MIRAAVLVGLLSCAMASAHGAAPLSESERNLLQGAISSQAATDMGKAADAAGLERIVALGDPALVQSFSYGMAVARIETMPPEVESVVVRHFDDERVGAALRALSPRYRTRALFDLHLARVQAAFKAGEPSFQQILRTDQPGIEDAIATAAVRFPTAAGEINPATVWLARRKHPAAVPGLIAAIAPSLGDPQSKSYNRPLESLVAYSDPGIWRRADAEVERVRASGGALDPNYATARRLLDPLIKDPQAALASRSAAEVRTAFMKRTAELVPRDAELYALQGVDPARYVQLQRRRLDDEEAIARELGFDVLAYTIFAQHRNLGLYMRFRLKDAKAAIAELERAAKGEDLLAQVALADTYQLELHDKANALRAYRLARETAASGRHEYGAAGSAVNAFWLAWLDAEIAWLETGRQFSGSIAETAIAGFWEAAAFWQRPLLFYFPQWPGPNAMPGAGFASSAGSFGVSGGRAVAPPPAPGWPSVAVALEAIDKPDLAQRLREAPASRMALWVTLRPASALKDPRAILAMLARNDPSGFWTTIVLGTVAWHEAGAVSRRDEALTNGIANALPGMAREPRPNPLAQAAGGYLSTRALRPVAAKQ